MMSLAEYTERVRAAAKRLVNETLQEEIAEEELTQFDACCGTEDVAKTYANWWIEIGGDESEIPEQLNYLFVSAACGV